MNIKIYFTEISEKENVEMTDFMQLVSTEKQERLNRYHFQMDRKLSLYAELIVRQQAMFLLGLDNNELEFGVKKHGKPFLQRHTSFHFNISYTRNALP
jgi:4'-phosphopantetheinyl transferase